MQLPHVFLQIEVPAEPFPAYLAGERFLVVVRVHVKRKIVDLMERLVAYAALVRFLAAVRQLVILVVPLLVETFPAELADERLEVGVYTPMGVQGGASVERFPACRTFVRFVLRVYDLVPAEGAGLTESLAADFADERTCAGVHGHVSGQVVVGVEHLAAFRAGEGLLFVRGCELVGPRTGTLLAALALGQDRGQAHPHPGCCLDCGGRR